MTVLFDHQTFSLQEYGGISRYICELMTGIEQFEQQQAQLSLRWSNNVHLTTSGFPVKPFFQATNVYKKRSLLYQLNKKFCQFDIPRQAFDVFHATYYDPYFLPLLGSRPSVVTMHDLIHERFGSRFNHLANDQIVVKWRQQLISRVSRFIAVSESTRNDLMEYLNIPAERIQVIHHGAPQIGQFAIKPRPVVGPQAKDYLLFVGNRFSYKNFKPFLQAVAPLLSRHCLHLICAGGGAFSREEIRMLADLRLTERVSQVPINDLVLSSLYRYARAFVFPSLYEGFGLPILEAFGCECPCAVSETSSLPEVAGSAAVYFNPEDQESMTHSVERLVLDDSLRNELVAKGNQQLLRFSWKETAQKTTDLYRSLS
ncbi:glycosyltransferase family 4 protein [Tellurirhabdus bombi]|uniref:glycosyltransferase family 4 protein n=1 Tax=Tellurirhabdus bombi TaxID=2907205 RepID=UPI001F2E70F9|nr:glycosyltransferase family 1 protein [Tellurirhabdus bombi]